MRHVTHEKKTINPQHVIHRFLVLSHIKVGRLTVVNSSTNLYNMAPKTTTNAVVAKRCYEVATELPNYPSPHIDRRAPKPDSRPNCGSDPLYNKKASNSSE